MTNQTKPVLSEEKEYLNTVIVRSHILYRIFEAIEDVIGWDLDLRHIDDKTILEIRFNNGMPNLSRMDQQVYMINQLVKDPRNNEFNTMLIEALHDLVFEVWKQINSFGSKGVVGVYNIDTFAAKKKPCKMIIEDLENNTTIIKLYFDYLKGERESYPVHIPISIQLCAYAVINLIDVGFFKSVELFR